MSVLGSVSVEALLDLSGIDKQLQSLGSKDLKPLKLGVELDTAQLQRELKQLPSRLDPIKVDLAPNVEDFRKKLQKLGNLSGSVRVELVADTEGLRDGLRNLRIDPVKVDLAPNVEDFQEKLRRVGRISPVTVQIDIDKASVDKEFREIGKYAAEGFKQGFNLVDDVGKAVADDLVASVKKQLGIQSPSRVFRKLGEYTIEGFTDGLGTGLDDVRQVVKNIEKQFKDAKLDVQAKLKIDRKEAQREIVNSRLKIEPEFVFDRKKIQKELTKESYKVGAEKQDSKAIKDISESIHEGFKKVKSGGLISSLFGAVAFPITSILQGSFMGVGSIVGEQVGTGISKGVQSLTGSSIGSLEILSQRAFEKGITAAVAGIPEISKVLADTIQSLPIGSLVVDKITNQLKIIENILDNFGIDLSPRNIGKSVKELVTPEEIALATGSSAFKEGRAGNKSRKEAQIAAINNFASVIPQRNIAVNVSQQISEKQVLVSKQEVLLKRAKDALSKTTSSKEKRELGELIATGEDAISQAKEEIENLKEVESNFIKKYLENISHSIELLKNTGINDESIREVESFINEFSQQFEKLSSLKLTLTEQEQVPRYVTSAAIKDAKLEKLQSNSDKRQQQLSETLANPTATEAQKLKSQKFAESAKKALDLYVEELGSPVAEFHRLAKDLKAVEPLLDGALQDIGSKLESTLPERIASATREVVDVGNLDKIPQAKPTLGQQVIDQEAVQREKERRNAAKKQEVKQLKSQRAEQLPALYVDAVQAVSRRVTGENLPLDKIPSLVPSDMGGIAAKGRYTAKTNTYEIKPELYQQIENGDISQITDEVIANITHEIFHAFQHGFGQSIAEIGGKPAVDISPTKEELTRLGGDIEASVSSQREERKPLSRQLETGAYVFADRNAAGIKEELKRNKLKEQALSLGGVAGNKIIYEDTNDAIAKVRPTIQTLQEVGANVDGLKASINQIINDARKEAADLGANFSDLDKLSTDEMEKLVNRYKEILQKVDSVTELAKNEVIKTLSAPKKPDEQPPLAQTSNSQIGLNNSSDVKNFLTKNLNANGVRELAGKMGVDTKNANKEYLINEISAMGGTAESRAGIQHRIRNLSADKYLKTSEYKPLESPQPVDISKDLARLQSSRRTLAASLKSAASLDNASKQKLLESIVEQVRETEVIASNLAKNNALSQKQSQQLAGTRTSLGNLSYQAKNQMYTAQSENAGRDIGDGLGVGFNQSMPGVIESVAKGAEQMLQTVRDVTDTHSPSEETKDIGRDFGKGLEIGADESLRSASSSIEGNIQGIVAQTAKEIAELNAEIARQNKRKFLEQQRANLNIEPKERKRSQAELDAMAAADAARFKRYEKSSRTVSQVIAERQSEIAEIRSQVKLPDSSRVEESLSEFEKAINELDAIINEVAKGFEATLPAISKIDNIPDELLIGRQTQPNEEPKKIRAESDRTALNAASMSATLQRKYGLEGALPVILNGSSEQKKASDQINLVNETLGGKFVQDIRKAFISKRKQQLEEISQDTKSFVAPGLQVQSLRFGENGDAVTAKQYARLSKKALAASSGIDKILSKPGEVSEKDLGKLSRLRKELEKIYEEIGRPLPSGSSGSGGFLADIGFEISGILPKLGSLLKGMAAFALTNYLQNTFQSIAQETFKAYVELDKLKTVLNFASGGVSGGSSNLKFIRQQVEDLKVPLNASIQGFTKLESAARGSALAGKENRELFKGLSQASTVLSLSGDETEGITVALGQAISKGKFLAEEQNQLAERIPGFFGIMARAAGMTEAEFAKLRDSGQIISQDILPKLGRQLQSEFGDAAKDASGNAQSAIFDLQNSMLSLQQGVGEGVAPAAIVGLNLFAGLIKGTSAVSRELGFVLIAVSVVLAGKMAIALQEVIVNFARMQLAGGTLTGGLRALLTTLNNSTSLQLGVGLFAAMELVSLLSQGVNTELVQSFDNAAKSAERAKESIEKAFNPNIKTGSLGSFKPESSFWFTKMIDDYLIRDGETKYGDIEAQNIKTAAARQLSSVNASLGEGKVGLANLTTGKGEFADLPKLTRQLQIAEQERAVLQAEIQRNFADKGLVVPSQQRTQLEQKNIQVQKLSEQRQQLATPFTSTIATVDRQISSLKAQLESLKTDDKLLGVLGQKGVDEQIQGYQLALKAAQDFKSKAEEVLGKLKVDPIITLTQAIRELNLALAQGQEKNDLAFLQDQNITVSRQSRDFGRDRFANKDAATQLIGNQIAKDRENFALLQQAVAKNNASLNAPGVGLTLQRLGINPDSSVSKINDIIQNGNLDDADKTLLEKVKLAQEQKKQLAEARLALNQSELSLKQNQSEMTLFGLDDRAKNRGNFIQVGENSSLANIKQTQLAKIYTEEVAAEKIAQIQLQTSKSQKSNIDQQLIDLQNSFEQQTISAEEYFNRRRDLTLEQSNLEKQVEENNLSLQQATLQKRIRQFESANKQAEAVINASQSNANSTAKEKFLSSGMGQVGQDNLALEQNRIDQQAAAQKTQQIKNRVAQNKQVYDAGLKDARDFKDEELALQAELAQANLQQVELRISAEEKKREAIKRTLDFLNKQVDAQINIEQSTATRKAKETYFTSGLTQPGQDNLAIEQNRIDQQTAAQKTQQIKNRIAQNEDLYRRGKKGEREFHEEAKALRLELAQANLQQVDLRIQGEEKYREIAEKGIQRIIQVEADRFRLATSQLESQKVSLELYNQSLERTAKLEESRYNLGKAIGDNATSMLEIQRDKSNKALELSRKLDDKNLDSQVRNVIVNQLSTSGFGTNELSILNERNRIEDEISAKKLKSLLLEQEYQRKALDLDLQRQQIAAQSKIYDSQGLQLTAEKAQIEAEGALRIAQIKNDDVAIKSAKISIELAQRDADIADKKLKNDFESLSIQQDLSKNAKEAQGYAQKSAQAQLEAAEAARKQGSILEKAEISAKKRSESEKQTAEAVKESSNAVKQATEAVERMTAKESKDWMRQNKKDSRKKLETDAQYEQRIQAIEEGRKKKEAQKAYDQTIYNRVTGQQLTPKQQPIEDNSSNNQVGQDLGNNPQSIRSTSGRAFTGESREEAEKRLQGGKIFYNTFPSGFNSRGLQGQQLYESYMRQNQQSQAAQSVKTTPDIKTSNGGVNIDFTGVSTSVSAISKKIDGLINSINSVAARPSVLQVSTPQPVSDGAKIYSDFSRAAVRNQGL